jgi:hypothetical protein
VSCDSFHVTGEKIEGNVDNGGRRVANTIAYVSISIIPNDILLDNADVKNSNNMEMRVVLILISSLLLLFSDFFIFLSFLSFIMGYILSHKARKMA